MNWEKNPLLGMINELREEKKVSWKALARGLCSDTMSADIGNGNKDADLFLMDMFIQRLGGSIDDCEIIVSKDEYDSIKKRDDLENMIFSGECKKAVDVIDRWDISKSYEKMYIYRNLAIISLIDDDNLQVAKKYLEEAFMAIGEIPGSEINRNDLLSAYEVENFIAYEKIRFLLGENKADVYRKLNRIIEYINAHFKEEEEKTKLTAKCMLYILKILNERGDYVAVLQRGREIVQRLGYRDIIYFMEPLLQEISDAYQKSGLPADYNFWNASIKAFQEIREFCGAGTIPYDHVLKHNTKYDLILDYELIRDLRKSKHFSQEELADGIFSSAKSVSNFEQGKTVVTRNNLYAMLKKLGLNKGRINSLVFEASYKMKQKKSDISCEISKNQVDTWGSLLDRLYEEFDEKIIETDAFFSFFEFIIKSRVEIEDLDKNIEQHKLRLSDCIDFGTKKVKRVLFANECTLLCNLYVLLKKRGLKDDIKQVFENVVKYFEDGKIEANSKKRYYLLVKAISFEWTKENAEAKKLLQKNFFNGMDGSAIVDVLTHCIGYFDDQKEVDRIATEVYYIASLYQDWGVQHKYYYFLTKKRMINVVPMPY